MNIDKDIERCKELIKTEHSNWIGMSNQEAIENVLKELEKEKAKNLELNIELKTFKQSNKNLLAKKSELETWKKIAEKLAEQLTEISNYEYDGEGKYYCEAIYGHCKETGESFILGEKCKKCLIDWARKEVENENNK